MKKVGNMKKIKYRVKNNVDFTLDNDFLETILKGYGVEDISSFLKPSQKDTYSPFKMKNMQQAVELLHTHLENESKIFMKIDCDVDGYTSGAILIQFLKSIKPNIKIECGLNYEKRHGLTYKDIENYTKNNFGLYIVSDASMTVANAKKIKENFNGDILCLDHHIIEKEYLDKNNNQWISVNEARELYKKDKDSVKADCYTNYCTAVNCTDGEYPNPTLTGVGVVYKFCLAYCEAYDFNPNLANQYLDLVSLGQIADSADMTNLETRYYTLKGLQDEYQINEFIKELTLRNKEDMKFGATITNYGWVLAPKINGCIRYGKKDEQDEVFKAICGDRKEIEYQPRRKSKFDEKPEIESHSLQWDAARICNNVKNRQDAEVRRFLEKIISKIDENKLDKNSILFIDGSEVIDKSTVTGLIANKLATKYQRPVVLMKEYKEDLFGGSARNYSQGEIEDFRSWISERGVVCRG